MYVKPHRKAPLLLSLYLRVQPAVAVGRTPEENGWVMDRSTPDLATACERSEPLSMFRSRIYTVSVIPPVLRDSAI
ncbi:hypothetical protein C8R44DRAFT_780831 [Mycena epipterygia]|nr:hypothetical protein C8R44DRAFT_780831 [Mycena epipterygia]